MTRLSVAELCSNATLEIETLEIHDSISRHKEQNVRFIDLRDIRELWREGTIKNAIHVPRGILEFWIDSSSPYSRSVFSSEYEFIFFCASGMRSALAAKVAQDMGLNSVSHIEGGFSAWKLHKGPTEKVMQKRVSLKK